MSKKVKYIIAIVVLLVANLWLLFSDNGGGEETIQKPYFDSENFDQLNGFVFATERDTVSLQKTSNGWKLNDQYQADEGFVRTLISVLSKVEVDRSFSQWEGKIEGYVEVLYGNNITNQQFQIATNPNKTKSYFIKDDEVKEVKVPGYRENVIDIFTLHADQWRDRTILDGNWRTIQRVSLRNTQGADFEITFDNQFFLLDGKPPKDSTAIVNYLNQFQQFQANEMVSEGRFPAMDSLANTTPLAVLSIDDIKLSDPAELIIFPALEDQSYQLVKLGNTMMVFDRRRIDRVLKRPE